MRQIVFSDASSESIDVDVVVAVDVDVDGFATAAMQLEDIDDLAQLIALKAGVKRRLHALCKQRKEALLQRRKHSPPCSTGTLSLQRDADGRTITKHLDAEIDYYSGKKEAVRNRIAAVRLLAEVEVDADEIGLDCSI